MFINANDINLIFLENVMLIFYDFLAKLSYILLLTDNINQIFWVIWSLQMDFITTSLNE